MSGSTDLDAAAKVLAEALHQWCVAVWKRLAATGRETTQHSVDAHFEEAQAVLAALSDNLRAGVVDALNGAGAEVLALREAAWEVVRRHPSDQSLSIRNLAALLSRSDREHP